MQLQLFVHSAQTRDLGKFVFSFARSCSWCALPAHCHTFARVVWPTDRLCGSTRILCITYTSGPRLTGDIVVFICTCNVAHLHTSCVYVIVFVICRYASDRYRSIILTSIIHICSFCHRLNQWQQYNAHLSTGKYSFMQCDY